MKQGLLVLLLFVAATAAAQQDDPNLVQNKLALMGGPRMIDSPEASDHGKSAVNNSIWDTSSQKSKTAGSQKRKQTQINKPAGEIKRPTIDASMVGYIDEDRKSTRLNSSHTVISYAVFCLKKKNKQKKRKT